MGDNISRQAALDAVSYETFECYEARKAIRALPSTDRAGHWILKVFGVNNGSFMFECSSCGALAFASHNFCPACGAYMRGADDESTI